MPFNILVLTCLAYVIFLFLVAFVVERKASRGTLGFLRSPLVYTLAQDPPPANEYQRGAQIDGQELQS